MEAIDREIHEMASAIHTERFSEEYDHMFDLIVDAADRNRGINPMNEEYQAEIDAKRKTEAVSALSSNGYSCDDESWQIVYKEAQIAWNAINKMTLVNGSRSICSP